MAELEAVNFNPFEDDSNLEAVDFNPFKEQPKPKGTWADTAKAFPELFKADLARSLAGGVYAAGDILGSEAMKESAMHATRGAQMAEEEAMKEADVQGTFKEQALGAARSVAQNIPLAAIGVATGGSALIPTVAMGGMTGLQKYGEMREQGKSVPESALAAFGHGATETLTEYIPMKTLLSKGKGFISRYLQTLPQELVGENIATVTQDAIDFANKYPEKNFMDYLAERPKAALDTTIQTALATGAMTGAVHPLVRVAEREEERRKQLGQTPAQPTEPVVPPPVVQEPVAPPKPNTTQQIKDILDNNPDNPIDVLAENSDNIMQGIQDEMKEQAGEGITSVNFPKEEEAELKPKPQKQTPSQEVDDLKAWAENKINELTAEIDKLYEENKKYDAMGKLEGKILDDAKKADNRLREVLKEKSDLDFYYNAPLNPFERMELEKTLAKKYNLKLNKTAPTLPPDEQIMVEQGKDIGKGEIIATGEPQAKEGVKEQPQPAKKDLKVEKANVLAEKPAESVVAKDTISIQRVDQPEFIINRGDTVKVFFSHGKMNVGKVVGISHAKKEVRVEFPNSVRKGGQWLELGRIYPTEQPKIESKKIRGKSLSSMLNKEPPGGWTEADKVRPSETAKHVPPFTPKQEAFLDTLRNAEAGRRELVYNEKTGERESIAVKSTFPQWIPSKPPLRSKKLINIVLDHIYDGTIPTKKNEKYLYDMVMDRLDEAVTPLDMEGFISEDELDAREAQIEREIADEKARLATEGITEFGEIEKSIEDEISAEEIEVSNKEVKRLTVDEQESQGVKIKEERAKREEAAKEREAKKAEAEMNEKGKLFDKSQKEAIIKEGEHDTSKQTDVGRNKELAGTTGRTGVAGRPDIRVVGQGSLPKPREIITSGQYPILDPNQRLGVNLVLTHFEKGGKGFLLADGTGVGKTMEILVTAKELANKTGKKALIITENKQVIEGNFKNDAKLLNLNFDNIELGTYTDLRLGKVGKGDYSVVIYDEAQNLKNVESGKTLSSEKVKADHKVFATATPMDRPTGASYFMSQITGIPESEIQRRLGYTIRERTDREGNTYKAAELLPDTSWEMVWDNIISMRDKSVKDGSMVRREYPFYGTIEERNVSLSEEQRHEQNIIDSYWKARIAATNNRNLKKNYGGQRIGELSRWLEPIKANAVVKEALQDIKDGKSVIIVAEGINDTNIKSIEQTVPGIITLIGNQLKNKGIGYASIFGTGNKSNAVQDFQTGKVQVAIATPKSGGTGINLDDTIGNRPRVMYVVTSNFSGDLLQQILGRVSRKNTKSPATVKMFFADNGLSDIRRKEIVHKKISTLQKIQYGADIDEAYGFDTGIVAEAELNKKAELFKPKFFKEKSNEENKMSKAKIVLYPFGERNDNISKLGFDKKSFIKAAIEPQLQGQVSEWTKSFQKLLSVEGIDFKVVPSSNQFPANARALIKEGDVAVAVYVDGTIYINSQEIGSRTNLNQVALHELIHAAGILKVLKENEPELYKSAIKALDEFKAKNKDMWDTLLKDNDFDLDNPVHMEMAYEELLARIAEQKPKSGIMFRVMQMIRKILRKLGINERYSDKDIIGNLIKQSMAQARMVSEWNEIKSEGEPAFLLAGKSAKGANITAMNKAIEMDKQGKSKDAIWKETGWIKGVDGKWRFEIDDSDVSAKGSLSVGERKLLKDALHLPALEKNYPQVMNEIYIMDNGSGNAYNDATKTITTFIKNKAQIEKELKQAEQTLKEYPARDDLKNKIKSLKEMVDKSGDNFAFMNLGTVLHEIQHAIQEQEGFARGGSPEGVEVYEQHIQNLSDAIQLKTLEAEGSLNNNLKLNEYFGYEPTDSAKFMWKNLTLKELQKQYNEMPKTKHEGYTRLAGEAEAREVSNRMGMTAEERANKIPSWDGIDEKDLIVRTGGGGQPVFLKNTTGNRLFELQDKTVEHTIPIRDGNVSYFEEAAGDIFRELATNSDGVYISEKLSKLNNFFTINDADRKQTINSKKGDFSEYLINVNELRKELNLSDFPENKKIAMNNAITIMENLTKWAQNPYNDNLVAPHIKELNKTIEKAIGEQPAFSKRAAQDQAYLDAVERGDMETAQKMVDEAAKEAGGIGPLFHSTWQAGGKQFTTFGKSHDPSKGFWLSDRDLTSRIGGNIAMRLFIFGSPEKWSHGETALKRLFRDKGERAWHNTPSGIIETQDKEYGGTSYLVRYPNQIKSADPVTYDDNGNVIPLSQRFQETSPDIRFSKRAKEIETEVKDSMLSIGEVMLEYINPKNLPEMSFAERMFKNPLWYNHPIYKKLVNLHIFDRQEKFFEYLNIFGTDPLTDEQAVKVNENLKKDKNQYGLLREWTTWVDENWNKTDEQRADYKLLMENIETFLREKGLDDKAIHAWKARRGVYDDRIFGAMEAKLKKTLEELKETYGPRIDKKIERLNEVIRETSIKLDAETNPIEIKLLETKLRELEKEKQVTEEGDIRKQLQEALSHMGDLRGTYEPRERDQQGAWAVHAIRLKDKSRLNEYKELEAKMQKAQEALDAQYDEKTTKKERKEIRNNYKVIKKALEAFKKETEAERYFEIGGALKTKNIAKKLAREGWVGIRRERHERLQESVHQNLRIMDISKAVEKALENVEGMDTAKRAFTKELLISIADIIKSRGARGSQIRRGTDSVQGYLTDPVERLARNMSKTASGFAKSEVMERSYEILGEVDNKTEPRVYDHMKKYIQEVGRNADNVDRLVNFLRGVASFKYLALNPRSALVNTIAIPTLAIPIIHQYAGKKKVSFVKISKEMGRAVKDYAMFMAGKYKGADLDIIEELHKKGVSDAQLARRVTDSMKGDVSGAWAKIMEGSMILFSTTEQLNRGATALAAYRVANERMKNEGVAEEDRRGEAFDIAADVTKRTHADYSKSNMPEWAWGGGVSGRIGQLLYQFGNFGHNYVQALYTLGFKEHNIAGFAWALLAPLLIVGGGAFPFADNIVSIINWFLRALGIKTGVDKWFWDNTRRMLGTSAEMFGRRGLVGLAGGDISGSMNINLDVPAGLLGLAGAVGGVAEDLYKGGEYALKGKPVMALEKILPTFLANPVKALREADTGIITARGNRIWTPENKPLMPTGKSTAAKVLGFRSSDQSVLQEREWEAKQMEMNYANERKNINELYKYYLATTDQKKKKELWEDFKSRKDKFNKEIKDKKLYPEVTYITPISLRAVARNMQKPTKKEAARHKER